MIIAFRMILFCVLCSFANRARGSQIFGAVSSTFLGRLFSMSFIAISSAALARDIYLLPIVLIGLMLFCTPAWDNYWSAAIGNPTDITKKAFMPVDFIMKQLPAMPLRAWGTIAMGLRAFICGYPLYVALGYYGYADAYFTGLPLILFGIPYFLYGLNPNKEYVIECSEFTCGGAIIGPTLFIAISQILSN